MKAPKAPSEEIDDKSTQGTYCLKVLGYKAVAITRVYLHSFSSCCLRNLRNPATFSENSNL